MPAKDRVIAAQFDRRIEFHSKAAVSDGQGGEIDTWTTVYTCWADIQNFPHGRGLLRKFLAQQLYPQVTTVIQIRFTTPVHFDATMRIQFIKGPLTHTYQIVGVENLSEANVSLFFYCIEEQAKGFN